MTETFHRSLGMAPSSLDMANGTVRAILTTGAPVTRKIGATTFIERLSTDPGAVTLSPHIPLLDTHQRGSLSNILGHVSDVTFEPGQISATLRISSRDALAAIQRGDVRSLSIGYSVGAWSESRDSAGQLTRTASKWSLLEGSLVPVPADAGAILRSTPGSSPMSETTTTTEPAVQRSEVTSMADRAQLSREVRALARTHSLPSEWADRMIDSATPMADVRAAALDMLQARTSAAATIRTHVTTPGQTQDIADIENRAIALAHQLAPATVTMTDQARQYAGLRISDHCRDILTLRGIATRGMSNGQILERAAMLTTGDLPALLENTGNRSLIPRYKAAQSPFQKVWNSKTSPDFRPIHRLTLSELSLPQPLNEAGEVKWAGVTETDSSYSLSKTGLGFSLSYESIVNDDLGALADLIGRIGEAYALRENLDRIALLVSNPLTYDNIALFSSSHGNLMASGSSSALSIASLTTAKAAFRNQVSYDLVTPINCVPAFLLVPSALETTARQILHTLNPTQVADVNPFNDGTLELLVDPYLKASATAWYLFASPSARLSFEESRLESASGPQIRIVPPTNSFGMNVISQNVWGGGVLDWRGCYKSPGA